MSSTTPTASDVNHESRAGKLVVATVFAIVLPTICLGLRILSRRIVRAPLYFDDWLIIIAWVFKIGLDISGALLIQHGMGRHISTVSPSDLVVFLKIQYTGVIQYPLCVTFTKLSILYQYRRLFPNHDFKMMTNCLITIMIMWCTAVMFTGVFICTPISKAWNPLLPGTCINLVPFYYGMQIPNVVTDFLILVMPFREVQRLELPMKQKVGVAFTCALWVISLAFGIVRLAVMIQLGHNAVDPTWYLVDPAIWTTIEPAVQITTACLPCFRVLYRKFFTEARERKISQRLRSLSLNSSRARNTTTDDISLTNTTVVGSYTASDYNWRAPGKEHNVYA